MDSLHTSNPKTMSSHFKVFTTTLDVERPYRATNELHFSMLMAHETTLTNRYYSMLAPKMRRVIKTGSNLVSLQF
ncbi:hypothetical protein ERO13_A05G144350v2 [Gossypium hirsutum]|uniref:Uncharacterized protein n=1 Tax=Gossypium darwinii TaxID=34276 RepID=A0A5D2GFR8_GOSDA|nr:hypothetical protein ERO13_A05G144350v2 [Gossypium hirsutum]TYH16931.1 hypothetical protein ES288_A05G153900v1 [Gossypium darwinii]